MLDVAHPSPTRRDLLLIRSSALQHLFTASFTHPTLSISAHTSQSSSSPSTATVPSTSTTYIGQVTRTDSSGRTTYDLVDEPHSPNLEVRAQSLFRPARGMGYTPVSVPPELRHPAVIAMELWGESTMRMLVDPGVIHELRAEQTENERLSRELQQYLDLNQRLTKSEARLTQELADVRVTLQQLRAENESLRIQLVELEKRARQEDAMMRISELLWLLDRYASSLVYGDSRSASINTILRERHSQHLSAQQQQTLLDFSASLNFSRRTHIRSLTSLRNAISHFRQDRNHHAHTIHQRDVTKQEFYGLVDEFCASFPIERGGADRRWNREGYELIDVVYQLLGDTPFQADRERRDAEDAREAIDTS